ncbi:hypothetical protein DF186_24370, partial [Enterococcus hirae]
KNADPEYSTHEKKRQAVSVNEFEKSIDDLHSSAERLTRGVDGVVQAIDTIAESNSAVIQDPDTTPAGKEGEAIQKLLK